MSLSLTKPKSLISICCHRSVSSFISKKRRQEIKERTIKENRRAAKMVPENEDELPIFSYAGTNRNPKSRVFAWGMACYGALGNPELIHPTRKNQKPKETLRRPGRVSSLELHKVKDIACGYGYSIFACKSANGHLFGTGVNNLGQIGYHEEVAGHPFDTIIKPVAIKLPTKDSEDSVTRVECGQAHTLALTKSGHIFSLGSNAYGQCGRPVIDQEDYFKSRVIHSVQVPVDSNDEIVDIECGINHSMFLSKAGQVFSCGWSADGQTGLGHYDNQENPAKVQGDIKGENIVKIVCTADNVLALNDQGEVFGWGNSEYAQFNMVTKEQQVCSPVKLNLGPVGKVIDIASGGSICLVLNDQHDVWVWGYGILGQGQPVQHSDKPLLLPAVLFGKNEFNRDVETISVYCGVHTCGAVNSCGDFYIWGVNKGDCLGLGEPHNQYFPFKVNLGGKVNKVSLGIDHSLALCKPYV